MVEASLGWWRRTGARHLSHSHGDKLSRNIASICQLQAA